MGKEPDKLGVRNIELIQTYYGGKKPPVKKGPKKIIVFPQKKKASFNKLSAVILAGILLSALIIIPYVSIRMFAAYHSSESAFILSPASYRGSIAYYDYGQIKNSAASFELNRDKSCIAINFNKPADLSGAVISFTAKSKTGGQRLAIILRDANNFSNANSDDIILTGALAANRWQLFNIKLNQAPLPLDKTKISQIRFDISAGSTGSDSLGEACIKQISIE